MKSQRAINKFDESGDFDGYLYHVTPAKNLASILADGLRGGAYLARGDGGLPEYYAETIQDEGETPVTLCVHIENIQEKFLLPDMPGIEEPITLVIEKSEDDVMDEWSASKGRWHDCFKIIGSVKYADAISSNALMVDVCGEKILLRDHIAGQMELVKRGLALSLGNCLGRGATSEQENAELLDISARFIAYGKPIERYVARIIQLYVSGSDNAYEAYLKKFGSKDDPERKRDIEFVFECAERDFLNGKLNSAVYQDVYDDMFKSECAANDAMLVEKLEGCTQEQIAALVADALARGYDGEEEGLLVDVLFEAFPFAPVSVFDENDPDQTTSRSVSMLEKWCDAALADRAVPSPV